MTTRLSTTFSASLFGLLGLALVASPTEASPLTSTSPEDCQSCEQNGSVSQASNPQMEQAQTTVFVPQPILAVEKNSAQKPNFSDRSAQPLQPGLKSTISPRHITSNAVVETALIPQVQTEAETASPAPEPTLELSSVNITSSNTVETTPVPQAQVEAETASTLSASALEPSSVKVTPSNTVETAPSSQVQVESETVPHSSALTIESSSGRVTSSDEVETALVHQVQVEAETASPSSASTLESSSGNATPLSLDSRLALSESQSAPSPEASVSTRSWAEELPPEAVPISHVHLPPSKQKRPSLLSVAWKQLRTPEGRTERPLVSNDNLANRDQEKPKLLVAQASPNAETTQPTNPDELRQELQVEPLMTTVTPTVAYPPSPSAGIPSGFGASWGDFFVSATAAGADRLRNQVDGSLSLGFGLGDPRTAVGVEFSYNLLSIRRFAQNGSFDVKVHRELFTSTTTQVSAAVGWNNFVNYGSNVAGTESGLYGVVSAAHLLQPENSANRLPITGTLGIGGGYFSNESSDVGLLAGVGLQVDPQLSINTAWSGVGLNLGASVVPFPSIPLTFNVVYGDVTNNTRAGSVAVFTIGYGYNFGARFGE